MRASAEVSALPAGSTSGSGFREQGLKDVVVYFASLAVLLLIAAAFFSTGRWRIIFTPFRIDASKMTVAELGLAVPGQHVNRVNLILASFAGGFNAMIADPARAGWERYCASLPPLGQPFAQEGAAMGYTPARLFRYDAVDFERTLPLKHTGFKYLHYVGLGFWSGMRGHTGAQLARITADLDPLYRYLCYDGYGFKHAFFDYPKGPAGLAPLNRLEGYARNAAYQGLGRAFFFHFMGDIPALIEHVERLDAHVLDAAGGIGLAAAFIFPDQIGYACELVAQLPPAWRADVHQGMCFGLKARSINHPEEFGRNLSGQSADMRECVRAALRACDRLEAEVRDDGAVDGYQRWRAWVRQWMEEHLRYPLAGLVVPEAAAAER